MSRDVTVTRDVNDVDVVEVQEAPAGPSLPIKLLAELLGTFLLFAAVLFAPAPGFIAASVSIMLVALVASIGNVSGSNVNPAVSIGLVGAGLMPIGTAIAYFVAQIIGGILAVVAFGATGHDVKALPDLAAQPLPLFGETIGAFILVFVICRLVLSGAAPALLAPAIGAALFAAIMVAAGASGAFLNPAFFAGLVVGDTMGGTAVPGAAYLPYIVGPMIGGLLGGVVARAMHSDVA